MTFDCRFSHLNWAIIEWSYSCFEARVFLGDSESLTYVTGNHLHNRGNEDVIVFQIDHETHLSRIPRGIENFFPDLVMIRWAGGVLTAVTADDLEPFVNLQILVLSFNHIVSLDSDLFKHNQKLEFLSFDNNLLEHVGDGLLTGMNLLTDVFFRNNPCIDMYARTEEQMGKLKDALSLFCSTS